MRPARGRLTVWRLMVAVAVAGVGMGAPVGIYRWLVGRPTTPMTAARADDIFRRALRPGDSQATVEGWLKARGIPAATGYRQDQGTSYDILPREEGLALGWMDARGNQTVAQLAGLQPESVHSIIRVSYPDADRSLISRTEVRVYLFFDADGRLLRQWVDEFIYGP